MGYLAQLEQALKNGKIDQNSAQTLHAFYSTYISAAESNQYPSSKVEPLLEQFLKMALKQIKDPFSFDSYHQRVTAPFNYYQFGLEFTRPLVISDSSQILHHNHLKKIVSQLAKGENVILLANHQTELDPQAISLALEKSYPNLAEEMIFVAGHRVVSDPLAIPFSMGRNLLCIYSKKYVEDDPETKADKLLHNQRTMKLMSQLLSEGGKCIYVAPSGGRDRLGPDGKIEVAPFDPQSIEMFWLMAQRADHPTHFYPLALSTYGLLPPPEQVEKQLGESRVTKATPIGLAFGPEIDMENFPGSDQGDKKVKRQRRAQFIWETVNKDYEALVK
jgi:glycerol-3-phosphate O-acyltransferase